MQPRKIEHLVEAGGHKGSQLEDVFLGQRIARCEIGCGVLIFLEPVYVGFGCRSY